QRLAGMSAAGKRLEALEGELASLAQGEGATAAAAKVVAAEVAEDRAHLRQLAATAVAPLPSDAGRLEVQVRQAEVRAEAAPKLAAGAEALASAERRLLLLQNLSDSHAAGRRLPLPEATEARALLERWSDSLRTFTEQDVTI